MEMLVSHTRTELLDQLIDFKSVQGRWPVRKDFDLGKIKAGKSTFYRKFCSLERAIQEAELKEKGEASLLPSEEIRHQPNKKPGSRCPFCGGPVSDINHYYDTLPQVIVSRFLGLLHENGHGCYSDAVLDCLYAVFGYKNKHLRLALAKEDMLGQFEDRHKPAETGQ